MADDDNDLPPLTVTPAAQLTSADRDAIIRTTLGEAGNDPTSQPGVASVIMNRMRQNGQTAINTVLSKNQFESWSARPKELLGYSPDSDAYQRVGKMVDDLASGATPDPVSGATNFYAPAAQAALGRAPPAWDDGSGLDLGRHRFFGGSKTQTASDDVPDLLGSWGSKAAPKGASAPAVSAAPPEDDVPDLLSAWGSQKPPAKEAPGVQFAPQQAQSPAALYGGLPNRNSFAGPLNNSTDDTTLSSVLKGGATAALKGVADIPGVFGNVNALASYIGDRVSPGAREQWNALNQSTTMGRIAAASDPMAYLPSGQGIFNNVKNALGLGEYTPQTPVGRAAMAGTEAAVGGLPFAGTNALATAANGGIGTVASGVSQATGDPLLGMLGAAAVPTALAGLGRTANALVPSVQPETAALASLAREKYGINVTAPQMSSNPGVRIADSAISRLPFSGAEHDVAAQQSAFNRAASNTIGEDAPKLTPDVMAAAKKRIGDAFNTVADRTTINADSQFQNELQDTLINAHHELADSEFKPLNAIFDNVMSKVDANGQIDGATYQALTRTNTPLGRALSNSNPNIAHWAGQIKDSLDSALQRSAPSDMQDMLSTARSQYRNLKTLEPLAAQSQTGDISFAKLQQAINARTGNSLAYGGGGTLGDLARIGQKFLKPEATSNTAERTHALNTLQRVKDWGLAAGATAVGANALSGMSPTQLALSAASVPAGAFIGRGIGSALRSDTLADAMINKSLGRGYQPSSANALLFRAVPPYLLQSTAGNALASPSR